MPAQKWPSAVHTSPSMTTRIHLPSETRLAQIEAGSHHHSTRANEVSWITASQLRLIRRGDAVMWNLADYLDSALTAGCRYDHREP